LGIGLGLVAGYYALSLRVVWPPVSALDRLLTIVIPAVLAVELIAGLRHVPGWVAWLLRVLLASAIPRILLHGSVYVSGLDGEWTRAQALSVTAGCSALLLGTWVLLDRLTHRAQGTSVGFALQMSTCCAGLTVVMAGYIKGGAAAIPLVATLTAMTIGAWLLARRPGVSADFGLPAILGVALVGLFGLLFIGRFFGRISSGSALAMLLVPLLCWGTQLPPLRDQKPWLVGSVRFFLVAIPLTIVLILAKREFDRDMTPLLGTVPGTVALQADEGSACCPVKAGQPAKPAIWQ
jgi:hypothetical protein